MTAHTAADLLKPLTDLHWHHVAHGVNGCDHCCLPWPCPTARALAEVAANVDTALDQARGEALREAANELVRQGPGVNAELRYDGTPDPGMSGYVEGLHDAWQLLQSLAKIDRAAGGGDLDV